MFIQTVLLQVYFISLLRVILGCDVICHLFIRLQYQTTYLIKHLPDVKYVLSLTKLIFNYMKYSVLYLHTCVCV